LGDRDYQLTPPLCSPTSSQVLTQLTVRAEYSHTGVVAKVPRLFQLMHHIGLSFQADKFLTEVVEIAAMANLRDLKYRARLPVEKGHLLYGKKDMAPSKR
jgi:hypothetical protein